MDDRLDIPSVKLESPEGEEVRRALAAEQRASMLSLLAKRAMNFDEIAAALGISQPTASTHIRILEDAGLTECEYTSTGRGFEKRYWVRFESLNLELDPVSTESDESGATA